MLKTGNTALIVVDVQEKLFRVIYEKDQLQEDLVRLVRGAQTLGVPVLVTEQNPAGLGPTLGALAELMPEMKPVTKMSFSCCGETAFMDEVKALGCTDILLTGIETHICVYQTALDLLAEGYRVHLVADGVSSRRQRNRDIAIDKIQRAGGEITTVEMALFELLGSAADDRFREISRIIK